MTKRYRTNYKKQILAFLLLAVTAIPAISQYYYKDIISIQQSNETYRLFKSNKVNKVTLNSFQGNMPVIEGFICEQKVNPARNEVITYTKTNDQGETFFTASYLPQGLISKTVDSTQESVTLTNYKYDAANRLLTIISSTHATDNSSNLTENHYWEYNSSGAPEKMLRIKDNRDTTTIVFKTDEKGNVAQENITGNKISNQEIYYYYDDKNKLTDVVRYNQKAKRLLPDYMFEYEDTGELSTMTIVPEGSSDYQKYYYKYDENGLKLIEFCYNKRKELMGKVEYKYSFGR